MIISCPHCGVTGEVDDTFSGRKVHCPQCSQQFRVKESQKPATSIGHSDRSIPIACPRCAAQGTIDPSFWGKKVRCPKCHSLFRAGEQPAQDEEQHIPELDLAEVDVFEESKGLAKESLKKNAEEALSRNTLEFLSEPVAEGHESASLETSDNMSVKSVSWTIHWALGKAWRRTRGAKMVFWVQTLLIAGVAGAVELLMPLLFFRLNPHAVIVTPSGPIFDFSQITLLTEAVFVGGSIISFIVGQGLVGGTIFTGVRRAAGKQVSIGMLARGFAHLFRLCGAAIFISFLVALGCMLFVLPGIYLAIAYSMTLPLIVDQRLGIWQAMEKSRKMVTKAWFRVFGIFAALWLLLLVSTLLVGVGLIWTVPMSWIAIGVVYHALFGERVVSDI